MGHPRFHPSALLVVVNELLDALSQFLTSGVRRFVLQNPCAHPDHLGQRGERHALAVREAPSTLIPDGLGEPIDVFKEPPSQPRLADAGETDDRQQARPALRRRRVEEFLEQPQLSVPPHEGRLETRGTQCATRPRDDAGGTPEPQRLGLALQLMAAGVAIVDRGLACTSRALSDKDAARIRNRLHPARGVHEVARDHAIVACVEVDRSLTREHARARSKTGYPSVLAEFRHLVNELERCSYSALRVVLVDRSDAPDRHYRITDELLDAAAVATDDRAGRREVLAQELADVLGIALLRQRCEADQIREEHSDVAPLRRDPRRIPGGSDSRREHVRPVGLSRIRVQFYPALATEQLTGVVLGTARSTHQAERRSALAAEAHAGSVLSITRGADHATKGTFLRGLRSTNCFPVERQSGQGPPDSEQLGASRRGLEN